MTKRNPRNLAASVRQRLMNLSRESTGDFQYILTRYGTERLLYRISRSRHGETFVLKGAALFQLWLGRTHRPTRDLDLLGRGKPTPQVLERIFQDICRIDVDDDGLAFFPNSVQTERIKEDAEYEGIRVRLQARLGSARIRLQVDVGFGDAITPAAVNIVYPTLLEFPPARVKAYPRETVIAEKFQAMVALGIANSRMKDFFDLWILAMGFDFSGNLVAAAIAATFDRRGTKLPAETPMALTGEFANDRQKQMQWSAFVKKGKLPDDDRSLSQIIVTLRSFLMPPTDALVRGQAFTMRWNAGGPWDS